MSRAEHATILLGDQPTVLQRPFELPSQPSRGTGGATHRWV
jgi:hypothetical protein